MSEAAAAPVAPAQANPNPAAEPVDAGAAPQKAAPVEPPKPRKLDKPLEVKLKGRVEKIEDWERVEKLVQQGFGASELHAEAKKLRDETDSKAKLLEAFKSEDPKAIRKALKELGTSEKALRAAAEEEVWEALQAEQMSPEQRRIRELEAREEARQKEEQTRAEKEKQEKIERAAEAEIQRWSKAAGEALQAAKVSPELAPVFLRRMQPYIDQAMEIPGMDPAGADVFEMFMADERSHFSGLVSQMDAPALLEWLGEDVANKIRKHDLQKLRAARNPQAIQPQQTTREEPKADTRAEQLKKYEQRHSFWDTGPHRE